MGDKKLMKKDFCNETVINKGFQDIKHNSPIKGWELLDKQSQQRIEKMIDLIISKSIKEIKLKVDGFTIRKGYAIGKDRKFDPDARLSDYLKQNSKISLNRTNDGVFGTKEVIF
jgi:hypothetical protein